ncbi:hypothetical protein AB6806_27240 [Bosea sp. RCC_152_1]|uniref:hypothetical protein n=1 Tax=Bosea sp. RCC_152_1 TaxID=3239228 RepID=UPI00352438B7
MASPYSWAFPGAKCICIEDDFCSVHQGEFSIPTRVPMIDEVLTIRDFVVGEASFGTGMEGEVYVSFYEIELMQSDGPLSGAVRFQLSCFRPLLDRPTDIAIFKSLLSPADQLEDA